MDELGRYFKLGSVARYVFHIIGRQIVNDICVLVLSKIGIQQHQIVSKARVVRQFKKGLSYYGIIPRVLYISHDQTVFVHLIYGFVYSPLCFSFP